MKRTKDEDKPKNPIVLRICRALFLLFLTSVLSGLGYWTYRFAVLGPYFAARNIELTGTHRADPTELIALIGINVGDNLLLTGSDVIRRRAEAHPWVRSAKVRKVHPGNLYIEIEERSPVAALHGPSWDRLHGLDGDGIILPELSLEDLSLGDGPDRRPLPIVTGAVRLGMLPGDPLPEPCKSRVVLLLKLIGESERLKNGIVEINHQDGLGIIASCNERAKRIRFGDAPIEDQINILEQAWTFLENRKIETEYIDLRNPAQGVVIRPVGTTMQEWLRIAREENNRKEDVSVASKKQEEHQNQGNSERG